MSTKRESHHVPADGRRPDESETQRLDRNYGELLQEIRVLQAGVQILFAFLLILPFQRTFDEIDDYQTAVYLATLLAATLAAICIIGPVPFHRLVFRRGMKEDLIRATTRYVAAGLVFIVVSMVGSVLLVLDVLVSRLLAVTIACCLTALFVAMWAVVPLMARGREQIDTHDNRGKPAAG